MVHNIMNASHVVTKTIDIYKALSVSVNQGILMMVLVYVYNVITTVKLALVINPIALPVKLTV